MLIFLAAPQRQAEQVVMEPEAVVEHEPEETLLWSALVVAVTTYATAILAARIAGKRERYLIERQIIGPVVILHLDAVVRVDPPPIGYEKIIAAKGISRQTIFSRWKRGDC